MSGDWFFRSPVPKTAPPDPEPGPTDPLAWACDFLLQFKVGNDTLFPGFYLPYPSGSQQRLGIIQAQQSRSYTDLPLDLVYPGHPSASTPAFDYWQHPSHVLAGMDELTAAGQRIILPVGFEGREMQKILASYGGLTKFYETIYPAGIAVWGHRVSAELKGVELNEWSTWDEHKYMVRTTSRYGSWPIVMHYTQGVWGPPGHELEYWRELRALTNNRLGIALQYPNVTTGPGGAFISPDQEVIAWTKSIKQRLAGIADVIAGEYAWLQDEWKARRLGGLGVHAGALGFFNGGTPLDALDPKTVTWLHRDVSGWPRTSAVTSTTINSASPVCIYHTMAGEWARLYPQPSGEIPSDGNPWVFAKIGGTWYGGTYEWLRAGQVCKGVTQSDIGDHVEVEPLESWNPQSGEQIGLMVSTRARDSHVAGTERSNIVLTRWP